MNINQYSANSGLYLGTYLTVEQAAKETGFPKNKIRYNLEGKSRTVQGTYFRHSLEFKLKMEG